MTARSILVLLTVALVPAVLAAQPDAGAARGPSLSATLKDRQGRVVGTLAIAETPHGLLVRGTIDGVPPGPHALHFHEVGKCEPPFTSAGGHFNPGHTSHGMLTPNGPHAGDLPNLVVPASGKLDFELFAPGLTLSTGPTALLDADGSAVVIHAKADDHQSQPAGDSGDRIACAVVAR
jgi:Cu-Zn family superoxide dismutase